MQPAHLIFTGIIGCALVSIGMIINVIWTARKAVHKRPDGFKEIDLSFEWAGAGGIRHMACMAFMTVFSSLFLGGLIWLIIQKLG